MVVFIFSNKYFWIYNFSNMKKFFVQLFDDKNTINEKAVVGFIAFFMT
jgi:hypothetical protein